MASINETEYGWTRNWEKLQRLLLPGMTGHVSDAEEKPASRSFGPNRARRGDLRFDVPTAMRDQLSDFFSARSGKNYRSALPSMDDQSAETSQTCGRPRASITKKNDPLTATPDTKSFCPTKNARPFGSGFANAAAASRSAGDRVGEATSAVVPWPHQVAGFFYRLYDNWAAEVLLIADESGFLEKTVQRLELASSAGVAGRQDQAKR